MAGGAGFKPTGFQKLKALLNPSQFSATLDKNVRRATDLNAAFVRKEMRGRIKESLYERNARLTIWIKHSSTPLIDDADLFSAITSAIVSSNKYARFVGVLRQAKSSDGQALYNIALDLHEGVTLDVTQKMRLLFQVLFEATHGEWKPPELTGRAAEIYDRLKPGAKIYPLKKDTTQIITKPRPFVREVFNDPKVLAFCKANWAAAVGASFKSVGG